MSRSKKRNRADYEWLWAMMADSELSSSAKTAGTALILRFKNGVSGLCCPGYEAIAKAVGRTRRPAVAAVAELRSRGWLTWDGTAGGNQTNTNRFIFTMRPADGVAPVLPAAPVPTTAPVLKTVQRGAVNGKRPVLYTAHELSKELSNNQERERARFLPDDFRLDDETHSWAIALLGSNDAVDRSVERFCNHYAQVSGPKAKSRNWLKKVRIWIDDDAKRSPQSAGGVIAAANRLQAKIATFDSPGLNDEAWDGLLATFVKTGIWTRHTDQCGSAPPSPNCRAPRHLLKRHGIRLESAA